jgi:hypothetical protein
MPIPNSPFDAAKSIFAGLCVIEFTPTSGTKLTFDSKLIDQDLDQEEKSIEMPDSNGVLRKVRTVLTKHQETFKFELIEAKRLLEIFGNALSGRREGVCTLWIPDPSDATGKIALKSEVGFACTVTRDGAIKFGDGDFTKSTIKITSNKSGAITWSADAATT